MVTGYFLIFNKERTLFAGKGQNNPVSRLGLRRSLCPAAQGWCRDIAALYTIFIHAETSIYSYCYPFKGSTPGTAFPVTVCLFYTVTARFSLPLHP